MYTFGVIALFPEIIEPVVGTGVVGRDRHRWIVGGDDRLVATGDDPLAVVGAAAAGIAKRVPRDVEVLHGGVVARHVRMERPCALAVRGVNDLVAGVRMDAEEPVVVGRGLSHSNVLG